MDRTMVVQLKSMPEQAQNLQQTLQEHTTCFNEVACIGSETEGSNGVQLHKETHSPLRAQYPDLPAQLVCAACVKATEAVIWEQKHAARSPKLVAQAIKHGKAPPTFKPVRCPASFRYDARAYWVRWQTRICSLASMAGRQEMDFAVPRYAMQYAGGKTCSADLCFSHRRYFLHIVLSIPDPVVDPCEEVIGVDLGLKRSAVTSTRQFLGERRWKEQERRIFRLCHIVPDLLKGTCKNFRVKWCGREKITITSSGNASYNLPVLTGPLCLRTCRVSANASPTKRGKASAECTSGPLPNCGVSPRTKQRQMVSRWST
jgi:hypothetical protein